MIVFDGELSIDCKLQAARKNTKNLSWAYLIMFIVLCPASLILYISDIYSEFAIELFIISFLFLPLGLLMFIMPSKKAVQKIARNHRIEFSGEQIVFITRFDEMNIEKQCWDIKQIKKIKDEGLYYEVSVFRRNFICEKRLLAEGSLTDFENRFSNLFADRRA